MWLQWRIYILVKGNISVNNTGTAATSNNRNKKVILKNSVPFSSCVSKINNTQVDNAENIETVLPIYNLIEYSDNYFVTSWSLWQYCKDIPAVNNNGDVVDFNGTSATNGFNSKATITGQTDNCEIKNIEIMAPFKYLSNFWITLEMPLIKCEVNLILT